MTLSTLDHGHEEISAAPNGGATLSQPGITRLSANCSGFFLAGLSPVVGFAVLRLMGTSASPPPLLDDAVLTAKATSLAHEYGLQGTPLAQRAIHMTLGQWAALTNSSVGSSESGLTSEVPIFLLALLGEVHWRGFGRLPEGSNIYDNMTIVLDARTGDLLQTRVSNSRDLMKIQVPLHPLTPAVPVLLVPTEIPRTPTSAAPMQSILDDQTLTQNALRIAQLYGLQGNPSAQRTVRVTLGQWSALRKAGFPQLSPDTPVFVVAMIGRVEWKGPGDLPPGQAGPAIINNIIVALNAVDGSNLGVITSNSASTMIIQVPLNTLTPPAPILFPPTEIPRTPPTQAPLATRGATLTPAVPQPSPSLAPALGATPSPAQKPYP